MTFFYTMASNVRFRDELSLWWNKEKLNNQDIQFLEDSFPFYLGLNPSHKTKFNHRLEVILTIKEFTPRGTIRVITREMKLLISSVIVMITFGFNKVRLTHFKRILVYPDTYYSTISKKYHRGEVNPRLGIIVVSWISFLAGLKSNTDGINLGIHEIAHALKLENQIHQNGESNFFDPKTYQEFQILAQKEILKINSEVSSIFRESGGFNEHEFFAVALEVFFERPNQLFDYNPQLYGLLVRLLQQDPRVWLKRY